MNPKRNTSISSGTKRLYLLSNLSLLYLTNYLSKLYLLSRKVQEKQISKNKNFKKA